MSDDPASMYGLRWEIRRSLIESLRIPLEGMGDMANQQRAEAAVQISTMMDEIEAWRQAAQKADRDINELRDRLEVEESAVNHLHTDRNNLRLEVERLRAERDETRRDLCRFYCANDTEWGSGPFPMEQSTPSMFATLKGWDCFKEDA